MNKNIWIICIVIAGAALFWFYREGKLGSILPWVLIAVCPIMHLFMMKNLHKNDDRSKTNDRNHSCH